MVETGVVAEGRKVEIRWSDEDGAYIATVPSLPGCNVVAPTIAGAAWDAKYAIQAWVAACRAAGNPVPACDAAPNELHL